jgi:hypothetical protein
LQGLVTCSPLDNGDDCVNENTIFVLPAGYRPAKRLVFSADHNGRVHARVDVLADGSVKWIGDAADAPTSLSLSGVTFRASQ